MKKPSIRLTDESILLMGVITLFGFSILAWAILSIFSPEINIHELVYRGKALPIQLFHGLIYGVAAFLIINVFIKSQALGDLNDMVDGFAKKLNIIQIIFISFAAGFGEELLFRITLQYYFDIWPTAIFFVMIHGYLNFMDIKLFSYGVVMTIISAGFGYLTVQYGIASAIMAHFVIDLVILLVLKYRTPITNLPPS